MRKVSVLIMILIGVLGLILACNPASQSVSEMGTMIHVNQLGYLPAGQKTAVVIGRGDDFSIVDLDSRVIVFRGKLGRPQKWEPSGEIASIAEFSELTKPGNYSLVVGESRSHQFTIARDVYDDVAVASVKAFYFHRAGVALEKAYAGIFARRAGHPDTSVAIHASAASALRPEGSHIPSPKGWYDAGDYGKYIVNSAITVASMMSAYEHYPEYVEKMETNIPESGDNTPDLLNEIKWNLDWMLSMQDPEDGGVYHKLTTKRFPDMIMPEADTEVRWIVMKTTPATLDFAAVMAQASRLYEPFDAEFSAHCLMAAKDAWSWAQDNRTVYYEQPEDIHTGTYDQRGTALTDEFFWAAMELSITTGEVYVAEMPTPLLVPEWRDGAAIAVMNLLKHESNDKAQEAFLILADSLLNAQQASAYGVSNDYFRWGSTSDFLNQAMVMLYAFNLTGDTAYKFAAQSNFDWVLGKNPTGYSFVTGFGEKTAKHIHHRPSEADEIPEPQPGWVIGGPNPQNMEDCGPEAYTSSYPALAYIDELCSYATNEIAINWNGAFVYLVIALSAEG